MSYPTTLDSEATLYNPVDAFSTAPLETTLTSALLAGSGTAQVANTNGFAPTWGILSVEDELIIYEAKDGFNFTTLHRGAFGTANTGHDSGVAVRALIVSAYIKQLQAAVIAIETAIGVTGSYNFITTTGNQTISGIYTFTNGIKAGSSNIATTGLVNLPNASSIAWRNAGNTADILVSVNASDHLTVPVIEFNSAQTFSVTGIADATASSKGIVQISAAGGLSVSSGILSITNVGTPGTYTKVTTNSRGQVTAGTTLSAGDLPALAYVSSVGLSAPAQFTVTGSPVTSSGTLTLGWASISPNLVLAGPYSGSPAAPTFRALVAADIPSLPYVSTTATQAANTVLAGPTSGSPAAPAFRALVAADIPALGYGTGTVTSVALTMPDIFSVAGSPITTSGTLAVTLATQSANLVWSGPASGGAAAPTFRSLVAADIPALSYISSTATQTANTVLAGPSTGSPAAPTFRSLVFADIPSTDAATASTIVSRDSSGGSSFAYVAANNLWAYQISHFRNVESGPFQTIGGPLENMCKSSEDFSATRWTSNGVTANVTVTANNTTAPDGNSTADQLAATSSSPIIGQLVGGLVGGTQMTFYVWLKTASGSVTTHLRLVNDGFTTEIANAAITITSTWTRFKVVGTVQTSQTQMWVLIQTFSGDSWTSGNIYAWGACLQTGNDPMAAYTRTWETAITANPAGTALGPTVITTVNTSEIPLQIYGPNSNLANKLLFEVNAAGELVIAGGAGNGYMLSQLTSASNPSGWSGVIQVKTVSGSALGYLLLYTNP